MSSHEDIMHCNNGCSTIPTSTVHATATNATATNATAKQRTSTAVSSVDVDSCGWLFVDGGYFLFYRWYALVSYYRRREIPNIEEAVAQNLVTEEAVQALFTKRCVETLTELHRRYGPRHTTVLAMDGSREKLWRSKIYPSYKQGRKSLSALVRRMFAAATSALAAVIDAHSHMHMVRLDEVEADDLLHVGARLVLEPTTVQAREADGDHEHGDHEQDGGHRSVMIIANDHDYLPLVDYDDHQDDPCDHDSHDGHDRRGHRRSLIRLHDMRGACVRDKLGCGESYLRMKLLLGDKSDNIPKVMTGCGPKTAQTLSQYAPAELKVFLDKKDPHAWSRYELNRQLIDNRMMPETYQQRARLLMMHAMELHSHSPRAPTVGLERAS